MLLYLPLLIRERDEQRLASFAMAQRLCHRWIEAHCYSPAAFLSPAFYYLILSKLWRWNNLFPDYLPHLIAVLAFVLPVYFFPRFVDYPFKRHPPRFFGNETNETDGMESFFFLSLLCWFNGINSILWKWHRLGCYINGCGSVVIDVSHVDLIFG